MVNITAFTQSCEEYADLQLIDATFANAVDSTYTYRCMGIFGATQDQSPPFVSCSDITSQPLPYPTFCIGGVNQQHACVAEQCQGCPPTWTCQGVDWTNSIAPACSKSMLNAVGSQAVGLVPICCNNSTCVIPDANSACDATYSTAYCVNDGISAECVDLSSNNICSGNFSEAIAAPTSGTNNNNNNNDTPSSSTVISNSNGNTVGLSGSPSSSPSSSSSSGGGLSASDIASIAGSIVGAITAIIGVVIAWRSSPRLRARFRKY